MSIPASRKKPPEPTPAGYLFPAGLRKILENPRHRLVILGTGNLLRSDDGLGMVCAGLIEKKLKRRPADNIAVLYAEEAIESYTGKIRGFRPTHVMVIDACQAGKKAGRVFLADRRKIGDAETSTHCLSLNLFAEYVEKDIGAEVCIIGVEPGSLEFGRKLSKPVRKAVSALADYICRFFARDSRSLSQNAGG